MKDYYAVLEVPPTASPELLREQYLFLIQAWHPDKFRTAAQKAKAEEKCKQLNIAYDVLRDSRKRAEYDRQLGRNPSRSGEQARRPPAENAPRQPQDQRQRQQTRDKQPPAQEQPRPNEDEAQGLVEQEWVRVYFEQARRRYAGQPPARAKRTPQKPIRILIVDDIARDRARLRDLLRSEADIRVVGEAPNASEAVAQFDALQPDVMIAGINRPILDEFAATEAIRRKYPISRIIILSVKSSTGNIRRAALAGACDYLIKPVQADDLRSAIRLAAEP